MAAEPQPGKERKPTVIAGYEVLDALGKGPLGTVYRARDTQTDELVVFRGFHRPADADEEGWTQAVAKYRSWLTAQEAVESHEVIQDIVAFGEAHGLFWIASEYFEGRNYQQVIDERGALPLEEVLPVFTEVAQAIDYAAGHGQFHGDLTPFNVLLLNEGGGVRLINYGMAHCRNKLGSPYLAPEQLTGREPDRASDVYGLGALLYFVLSGAPPFAGATRDEVCQQVAEQKPPDIDGLPRRVNRVLAKMLAKTPSKRYATCAEALAALSAAEEPEDAVDESVPMPWNPQGYQPEPSLSKYNLAERDFVDYHRELRRAAFVQKATGWAFRAAVISLLIAFVSTAVRQPNEHRYAQVLATTGKAELADGNGRHVLKVGERIDGAVPSLVRTGADSTAVLGLRGGRVKLGPKTSLMVRRLGYSGGRVRSLQLYRGRIWVKAAHMPRRGSLFQIYCGPYRVKVKGTYFDVNAMTDPQQFAGYCQSESQAAGQSAGAWQADAKAATSGKFGGAMVVGTSEGEVEVTHTRAYLDATQPAQPQQEEESFPGEHKPADKPPVWLVGPNSEAALVVGQESREEVVPMTEERQSEFQEQLAQLLESDGIQKLGEMLGSLGEGLVLSPLDLAKSLAGQSPGEALTGAIDDVEILSRARVGMSALSLAILMAGDEVPESIGLSDLSGLGFEETERNRILSAYDGHKLLSYEKLGMEKFRFEARAADSKKTLLRCENGKVEIVGEKQDEF